MSEQHDGFKDRHLKSVPAVFAVARWLHLKGNTVEIPGFRQAATAAEHAEYRDAGDLFVLEHGERHCYQVRHTPSTHWTCAADWPHRRFFVAGVKAADRDKGDRVWAYVFVNDDFSHMAIARADQQSRQAWTQDKCVPSNTNNLEQKYCVDVNTLAFLKL
jgi:hypothetical protein